MEGRIFTWRGADQGAATLFPPSLHPSRVRICLVSLPGKCHPGSCFRILVMGVRVYQHSGNGAGKGGGSYASPCKE